MSAVRVAGGQPGVSVRTNVATRRKSTLVGVLAFCASLFESADVRAENSLKWVVCYSADVAAEALLPYELVVLDLESHPPLDKLLAADRHVLAYLSLTEMGRAHAAFGDVVKAGLVLDQHPVWTGSQYIDFRSPAWSRIVVEQLVPRALEQGFTGLFLDTLDDAEFLETKDPKAYQGMREAAISLVRDIRRKYPSLTLMVNRGYAVLPDIAGSVDIVLGESVIGSFDGETGAYKRMSDADIEWQVSALRAAKARHETLKVFTLDYWDPKDGAGVARLYREQRANGFAPYVSTPMLDAVVPEPR